MKKSRKLSEVYPNGSVDNKSDILNSQPTIPTPNFGTPIAFAPINGAYFSSIILSTNGPTTDKQKNPNVHLPTNSNSTDSSSLDVFPSLGKGSAGVSRTQSSIFSLHNGSMKLADSKKFLLSQWDVWKPFFAFILLFEIITFMVLLIPVYETELPSQVTVKQLGYLSLTAAVAILWSLHMTLLVPQFQWSSFLGPQEAKRPKLFCYFLVAVYTGFLLLFNLITMATGVFPIRFLTGWMPAISYVPIVYGLMWFYWTMSDQNADQHAFWNPYSPILMAQENSMLHLKGGFLLFVKLNMLNMAFFGVAQCYIIITYALKSNVAIQISIALVYKCVSIPLKLLIRQYSIKAGRYLYPPLNRTAPLNLHREPFGKLQNKKKGLWRLSLDRSASERSFALEPHEFAKLMTNWSHAVDCFFSMMVFLYVRAWYFTMLVIVLELVLATAFPYFDKIEHMIANALGKLTAQSERENSIASKTLKSSETEINASAGSPAKSILKTSVIDEVSAPCSPFSSTAVGADMELQSHRLCRTNALQCSAPDISTDTSPRSATDQMLDSEMLPQSANVLLPTINVHSTVQRRHSINGDISSELVLGSAVTKERSMSTLQKLATQVHRFSSYSSLGRFGSSNTDTSTSSRKRSTALRIAAPQIILKSLSKLIPTYFSVHDRIEIVFSNLFIIFLSAVSFVPWSFWLRYSYNSGSYNAPFRQACFAQFNRSMIIAGVQIVAVLIYMVAFEFWVQKKISTGASTNEGLPLRESLSASRHLHSTLTDSGNFSLWRTGLQSLRHKFWLFLVILLNAAMFPIITLLDQNSILMSYESSLSEYC